MKKYLLPEGGKFYKANLHSHSTVSDGAWTPEEIKERYMSRGYSVVAYTDHHVMIPHNELTDENFVALNGVELGVNNIVDGYPAYKARKNCDICMIALTPDNLNQPCWNKKDNLPSCCDAAGKAIVERFGDALHYDDSRPSFVMKYDPEIISSMMQEARECGFFVTHNHPVWSSEEYTDYIGYDGMHAMEICNYGCVVEGHDEHNAKIYLSQLRAGKRIFCTANDDNHNKPTRKCDSFGAFTMIKAEKLEYTAITDALLRGDFYASEGPIIEKLWYEDGKVYVECSPAQAITITKMTKNVAAVFGEDSPITGASFDVAEDEGFFFITVTDEKGNKAYTNAYFLDDILR